MTFKTTLRWAVALVFALAAPVWAAVDINVAPQSELESVPGIGPVKARAIIDYRKANGPFKSLDDLDHVRGFGKATIDKLRGQLVVEPDKIAPVAVKQEIRWSRRKATEACPGCPPRE